MPTTKVLYWSAMWKGEGFHSKTQAINKEIVYLQKSKQIRTIIGYQEVGTRQSNVKPSVTWVDFVITYQEDS